MIEWDTLRKAPLGVYVLTVYLDGFDRYHDPVHSKVEVFYPSLKCAYAGYRQMCVELELDENRFRLGLVSTTLLVSHDCEAPHLNYYQLDLRKAFAKLNEKSA